MTSPFSSLDASARTNGPAKKRTASVLGGLAALFAVAWSGCGPGSESRYYCDDLGCYDCDAYGCRNVAPPTKQPCTGQTSCPEGSVCTDAGCTVVCVDDTACPQGEVCKSGLCAAPGTEPGPKKDCTTRDDCGASMACVGGTCETCGGASGPCPCDEATPCEGEQVCIAGACTSPEHTCKFSSECAGEKVCAEGQCLDSCESAPCADGFTCDKGVCKPSPVGGTCTGETTCPAEAPECVSGTCVKTCTDHPECGDGKYCNQGACVVDTRPTPNCTADSQCGGTASTPKRCLGGFCKFSCTSDQYCRTIDSRIGYCAADKVCRTAAEASAECFGPGECGDKSCVDNRCL
jgi:hypothetical protein